MMLLRPLANIQFLRALFFPILRNLNLEIKWTHDVTRRPFFLMTWLHKSYWFYGSNRERDELAQFQDLIDEGDCVVEIGGHIGYLSQIFEELVGENGAVYVAEPTSFSRSFLEKNVSPKTTILPLAMSDRVGALDFYTEEHGGFTNSLMAEFTETADEGLQNTQKISNTAITKVTVPASTVDAVCDAYGIKPDFLKIDVEGAELNVLRGAAASLAKVKALMVEVNRNQDEVYDLLFAHGFKAKDAKGNVIDDECRSGNIFFHR